MRTPHSEKTIRVLRLVPLALVLCLWAAPAVAQVDDALIQRYADLNVQAQEIRYLRDSNQIDGPTYTARREANYNETRALDKQLVQLSFDAQRQARNKIDALTQARLATLRPQWDAKIRQSRIDDRQRRQDLSAAVTADARAAVAVQRRRLELQQQKDRGEITPEQFAAEDKKALDEIMALRAKHENDGPGLGEQFDRDLQRLTAEAERPAAQKPLTAAAPKPQVAKPQVARPQIVLPSGNVQRAATPAQPPPPTTTELVIGVAWAGLEVVLFVGGVYLIYRLVKRKKKAPAKDRVSDIYGTAHYAPLALDASDACLAEGVFFGKSNVPERKAPRLTALGAPICSTPEHHTLIVARTRTGKGTRVIIPTLLRYQGSALVIDPKGENAAVTARIRRECLGQDIHILNPWNELVETYGSRGFTRATFNPLDVLDKDDPNVVALAQSLAATICPAAPHGKDRFWQGSAANMLTAVLLWITKEEGEKKTLGRAREIVSLSRKDLRDKFLVPMAASESFDGAIREMAAPFIDLAQETYSGVMANLAESTRFLSDPQMKAATGESSFSMTDLATKRATAYVVIPAERMDTQKTWLRLIVAAAMHTMKRARANARFDHRCLFLIDEFAALGRMDDLPRDIATMSGFGVDFALIVQGIDQLKDHYGEASSTILSNCAYKWFCNVNDLESAKYLSETLGKKTVRTVSTSTSHTSTGDTSSSTTSTSLGETGRSLLNPDEVLHLGRDVALALQPHGHPHYLQPVDYWNLPEAFTKLRDIHPGFYWDPPLAYDENPFSPSVDIAYPCDGATEASVAAEDVKKTGMSAGKARKILGVQPAATRAEIGRAYLRTVGEMLNNRADGGYSPDEINAARAVLLGVETLQGGPVSRATAAAS